MIVIEKLWKVYKLIVFKYNKLRIQLRKKPDIKLDHKLPVISLGTQYGGWKVPEGFLDEQSICYFAGAGIDISFDVEVAKMFGSKIYIIDPTPVAKQHYEELIEKTRHGEKLEINRKRGLFYETDSKTLELLSYQNVGIWSEDTSIKFYEPGNNKTMVSHSIVNLHGTASYFEAEVVKISTLMKRLGHSHIDFLKIDIEGAEYEVIQSIVDENLDVGVLGIEFDEIHHPMDKNSLKRIEEAVRKLRDKGFLVVDIDTHFNITFVKDKVYAELSTHKIQ